MSNTKKKTSLLFCLLLFYLLITGGHLYADNNPVICKRTSPLYPGRLYTVFSISFPASNTGWLSGMLGHIWVTLDRGKSWSLQPVPSKEALSAISFTDLLYGWAVGYGGTILHTSDGGKKWERQKSSFNYYWKSVWIKDKNHGWIAGEHGTIIATHDSGTTWQTQISGDDVILNSIAFSPHGHGWAVGEFGVVYMTQNGKDWILQDNGIASNENTLWSVCYAKQGIAIASGIASTLIISDNNGDNWRPLNNIKTITRGKHSLFRVFYFKNKIITFSPQAIFYSKDMGKTWKNGRINTTLDFDECLYDCSYNKDMAWIAGTRGSLLQSSNGTDWTLLNPDKKQVTK